MARDTKPRRLECDDCGVAYQIQVSRLEGFPYEVYVCPNCGDTLFTMEQARAYREVHALAELASKDLGPLKLRQVGNSVNATVPKEFAAIGFHEGRRFQWEIEGPGAIRLRLLADTGAPEPVESPPDPSRSRPRARRPATRAPRKGKYPLKERVA